MRTIPKVESLDIEFKSDLKCYPDHNLIEEVVGMTNAIGGSLFLGVEDDGIITGIHKKHRDAIGVTALIANSTVPPIAVRAEIIA
ncbi:MAG: ATP-binding protein [Clostridiales bacterium]|nr:ATP-binding protein [Clostridiales bacterium]